MMEQFAEKPFQNWTVSGGMSTNYIKVVGRSAVICVTKIMEGEIIWTDI